MSDEIKLLQFMICREFGRGRQQDVYSVEGVHSNLYVPRFPHRFEAAYVVTCWRKDSRFHKEVLEYSLEDGTVIKTPPMDIEPVTDSVLFRWHKHLFPADLVIKKQGLLTVRVTLDWKLMFESYVMVEKAP